MDKDSIKGKAEKVAGRTKEATGNVTGNDRLKAEGVREQVTGELHDTWGALKQAGKDVAAGSREGTDAARRASRP